MSEQTVRHPENPHRKIILMPAFLSFPVNAALAAAILAVLWVVDAEYGQRPSVRLLRSSTAACWLLGITVAWCIIGGLVPPQWATDGSVWQALGFGAFPSSWGFRLLVCALLLHLALVIIHRLRQRQWQRNAAFLMLHGGLWFVLAAGSIGAADRVEGRALVTDDTECCTMFLRDGRILPLAYSMHLAGFEVERSMADSSVVQYTATIVVDSAEKHTIAVNNPYGVRWDEDLYLTDYTIRGTSDTLPATVIMVVREPWKPVSLGGILMLAVGMLLYVFRTSSRSSSSSTLS